MRLRKRDILREFAILLGCFLLLNCSSNDTADARDAEIIAKEEEPDETVAVLQLNLRIHLMQDVVMTHPTTGVVMDSWVTPADVEETIIPELNSIWEQASVQWAIESIIEEDVVKSDTYQQSINYIVSAKRDENGNSDPERLPHLFSLMQPEHMSTEEELDKNLFHIYLCPFIGNTSQGNAMQGFNKHSVVGTWTNKFNGGGAPEKTFLTESQGAFLRGSLTRTIAHEIGHVLTLSHNECDNGCLMGGRSSDGYNLTDGQIIASRIEATIRSFK